VAITLEVYLKKNEGAAAKMTVASGAAVENVETQETAASTPPP